MYYYTIYLLFFKDFFIINTIIKFAIIDTNSNYCLQGITMNEKILKLMNLYKNKAILINNGKDLFYLTGAKFEDFWLLLYKSHISIIVHEMIEPQVNQHFKKYKNKIKVFSTNEKMSDKLTDVLKQYKVTSLIIDSSNISLETFDIIKTKLSKAKIKVQKEDNFTHDLRVVKDKTFKKHVILLRKY